ncbi:phosphocholine-specific phospholipase C [Acidomonas methanolica]|uniref:phosphocholine-specific phospholipase C n=1 Tax=Acidomonas methanolica TaxID=437 RepID=UPI00211A3942|nr:phospholipase C, phosphocholine-specific [Acidomonas methanolica]MCQ9156550.1 phospholipase C, phosphocholine-specific [Acidomonas methanolica]
MAETDRRDFLKLFTVGGLAGSLQQSIARAASLPANNVTGTIRDVEHVIFLMQENRSFDHYYGRLQGVRGFNDPRAARLTKGTTVFDQPHGGGALMPFHPEAADLGLQFIADLAHDWTSTQAAFSNGRWNGWIDAKTTTCMAYMDRADIPFHYALADAFTICDAYHCSILSSTDPNRYYMWTGWVGNDGSGGGPIVDNAEAGYAWSTYPERLQAAGVSWKIYQDIGTGLDAAGSWGWASNPYIGNYGDTSLLYFDQYRRAAPGSPLAERARSGTNIVASGTLFDLFRQDVQSGALPQVSWLVAPEAYSEHPNWPANYGAWYVSQVLDVLTAAPEIWSKTVLFITFDENDGFFDHLIPPAPPVGAVGGQSTVSPTNEFFPGSSHYAAGPYGFGPRVPMLVVSPWSRGGWVNSQVFDHTSLIRFLETRFGPFYSGLTEPNITVWRRAVSGDLTSAFDFKTPNAAKTRLPSTASYAPPDRKRHANYTPAVPATQIMPRQERGVRPARALPYDLHVQSTAPGHARSMDLTFVNTGSAAAVFHVRDLRNGVAPRYYTVENGRSLVDHWLVAEDGGYALDVHGPNGFFRSFAGLAGAVATKVSVMTESHRFAQSLVIELRNHGDRSVVLNVADAYGGLSFAPVRIAPLAAHALTVAASHKGGWYDVTITAEGDSHFAVQLAGHLENDRPSITDPLMGGVPGLTA